MPKTAEPKTAPEGESAEAQKPAREKMERPANISDETWALGRILGNVALASDMLAVLNGERAPKSQTETTDMMRAAGKLRDRSMKKYLKLREVLQGKLDESFADYKTAKERSESFESLLIDPQALVKARAASQAETPQE